jgi:hypothetical protein
MLDSNHLFFWPSTEEDLGFLAHYNLDVIIQRSFGANE